jgi:hypothetical protein
LGGKLRAFGKAQTVRGHMETVETHAFRVSESRKENGRKRGLPAGEEHVDFALGSKRNRVVEERLYLCEAQFMDVARSVCIHKAGRAHHVAAIREINDQVRSASRPDAVWSVIVHLAVADTCKVPTECKAFHLSKEIRVVRERILERPMSLARLPHEDTVSFLQNLRLNDPRVFPEIGDVTLTAKQCFYRFAITVRA